MTEENRKQMFGMLNARLQTLNMAFSDLVRDMNQVIKSLNDQVDKLEKETAELKAKHKEKTKNP
jgi:uncharacterized protein YoxC